MDVTNVDLAIVGALGRELDGLYKRLGNKQSLNGTQLPMVSGTLHGKRVMIVQSGIGRARAIEAGKALIRLSQPNAIVVTGFCGAVDLAVRGGDVVLADQIAPLDPQRRDLMPEGKFAAIPSDGSLMRVALQENSSKTKKPATVIRGLLGTALQSVSSVVDKMRLRTMFPSLVAVDMESYWIADVAKTSHIPCLAIRAVSDEAGDRLPAFEQFLDDDGRVKPFAALRHFVSTPKDLALTPKLAARAHRASKNLVEFLDQFIVKV